MVNENSFDVFISSSDAYCDIWPIFFQLFAMHWPDYKGVIYLNTQKKMITYAGLNIVCTCVGEGLPFGQTFKKGLDKVENDNVLLMMIDYIFMERVDAIGVENAFAIFKEKNMDSLCLIHQDYDCLGDTIGNTYIKVLPPSRDLFSFQIAFWKKAKLKSLVLDHETPWAAEWFGTKRANKNLLNLYVLTKKQIPPILYDAAGCLHKGKWLESAVSYLRTISIDIPVAERGIYDSGTEKKIKTRILTKIMLVKSGLKGSYWY